MGVGASGPGGLARRTAARQACVVGVGASGPGGPARQTAARQACVVGVGASGPGGLQGGRQLGRRVWWVWVHLDKEGCKADGCEAGVCGGCGCIWTRRVTRPTAILEQLGNRQLDIDDWLVGCLAIYSEPRTSHKDFEGSSGSRRRNKLSRTIWQILLITQSAAKGVNTLHKEQKN